MVTKKYPKFVQHRTKEVKIREDRQCFFLAECGSGLWMNKGDKMLSVIVLPSSSTGQLWGIIKPARVWFCGECKQCHSEWGQYDETETLANDDGKGETNGP